MNPISFNISSNASASDRVNLSVDYSGRSIKLEGVKTYKGMEAVIARWLGLAKEFKDSSGSTYTLNIRSVGDKYLKAEPNTIKNNSSHSQHLIQQNKVKDIAFKLFLQKVNTMSLILNIPNIKKNDKITTILQTIQELKKRKIVRHKLIHHYTELRVELMNRAGTKQESIVKEVFPAIETLTDSITPYEDLSTRLLNIIDAFTEVYETQEPKTP